MPHILYSCTFLILVASSCYYLIWIKLRRSEKSAEKNLETFDLTESTQQRPVLILPDENDISEIPSNNYFEYPIDNLQIVSQLGKGEYGVVYKGIARGINSIDGSTTVAVKTLIDKGDSDAHKVISSELKILSKLGHHLNIVNLLGAVTRNTPNNEIMIILEFCPHGSLHSFLQKNRKKFQDDLGYQRANMQKTGYIDVFKRSNKNTDDSSRSQASFHEYINIESKIPKTSDLLSWSYQCSRGMEFLASNKVIHGDLAARNVLLCNGNVVKISDFGLSQSLYSYYEIKRNDHLKLPYKWLAIECFTDNIYSTKSDVWSFGIFLWELFSLCQLPYPGFVSSKQLFENLMEGYRMEKPDYSNDEVYRIMRKCWEDDPSDRPTFGELAEIFQNLLHETVKNVS